MCKACGIPLGRRSGSRLATKLVATLTIVFSLFFRYRSRCNNCWFIDYKFRNNRDEVIWLQKTSLYWFIWYPSPLESLFIWIYVILKENQEQGVWQESFVLKLWYLEEAHIPPTIPKNHKVRAFSEKMAAQKATQTLIYTPPL